MTMSTNSNTSWDGCRRRLNAVERQSKKTNDYLMEKKKGGVQKDVKQKRGCLKVDVEERRRQSKKPIDYPEEKKKQ